MKLPADFLRRIVDLHGEHGRQWLDDLPSLIEYCADRYSVTVHEPFPNLSYNYVAPATDSNGREIVLKLGVPHPELTSEIVALDHYAGRGAVRLLESDSQRGMLLQERLLPGRMLSQLEDDEYATRAAAAVMRTLWRTPPDNASNNVKRVGDWANGMRRLRQTFDGGTGPFPVHLVDQAERLFDELLRSSAPAVLLHGDLHHYNILSSGEGWLAIDPKGVIGEPAYEVGALLRNPWPQVASWSNLSTILDRRVQILNEELGFDRQRMIGWGIAQSVLAAWWSYEDGGSYETSWLAMAEALSSLLT